MSARNRAVHGDIVIVEILPKNQWQGRSTALRSKTESDGKIPFCCSGNRYVDELVLAPIFRLDSFYRYKYTLFVYASK